VPPALCPCQPNEAEPTGESYALEKDAEKLGGGDGYADVWKKGHFAWEHKGKRKDLAAAYRQLNEYREALDNPPTPRRLSHGARRGAHQCDVEQPICAFRRLPRPSDLVDSRDSASLQRLHGPVRP
jgi:hypothetical protein